MNKVFLTLLGCVIGLGMWSSASASLLTSLAVADGSQDLLNDTSVAGYKDNGAAGLSVDDVIFGIALVQDVNGDTSKSDQIAVVFSAKIIEFVDNDSSGTISNGDEFKLGYNDTGDYDLTDLLPASLQPKNGRAGTLGQDEIAVVISHPTTAFSFPTFADFAGGTAFNDPAIDYEATIGLVDDGVGGNDFFSAIVNDNPFTTNQIEMVEAGGFSVMDASGSYGNGPGTIFLPVTGLTTNPEVGLFGSVDFLTNVNYATEYGFTDDADFFINAVPEPASVAVWSLLAIGCVAFGRRRLSRKAA